MSMSHRPLGGTGIRVSPYCLGTMMFGGDGNRGHDDCVRIIHAALGQGINFVDTADMYGAPGGETEEIVGTALRGRRGDVVLATKVHFPMGEGPGRGGNSRRSRRWIRYEVEQSLRRLQTDWIDLYQIHRPHPGTDIEETLSALTNLLAGASLALGDELLDRIDEIVPPGANLYSPDSVWRPPALAEPALRRRPLAERAAA